MVTLAISFIVETIIFGALIFFLDKAHRKETADLHLRLASRDLSEFYYWKDGHELEVEHNRKVLEKVRDEKTVTREETPEEREKRLAAKGF